MAEREVIREFLTKLSFQIDEPSFRKFMGRMDVSKSGAFKLSASVLGVVTALETMVTVFASGMEQMYYRSRRTGATVENLRALEFGFGQIGLRAEDAQGAVESLAATTRNNPGLNALLQRLTGSSERDPTKQLINLVNALKQMPYFVGSQFAGLFGIDDRLFRMLTLPGALDKLNEAQDLSRDMYRRMGVDQEQAAAASKEFMNTIRTLRMELGVLADKFVIDVMPAFQSFNGWVSKIIQDVAKLDHIDLPNIGKTVLEASNGWEGLARAIAKASEAAVKFTYGEKAAKLLDTSAFWALVLGGPNYQNGGRRDGGLFPPGSPGYEAARRTMAGEPFPKPDQAPPALPDKRGAKFAGEFLGDTEEEALNIVKYWASQGMTATARVKTLDRPLIPGQSGAGGGNGGSGAPTVTVQQNNRFEITSDDAHAAGEAVAASQGRASRDLGDVIRNSAGALR